MTSRSFARIRFAMVMCRSQNRPFFDFPQVCEAEEVERVGLPETTSQQPRQAALTDASPPSSHQLADDLNVTVRAGGEELA